MTNIFFNAHHSPIGAFASFTLGYKGQKGGIGAELRGPADQNVFVGIETKEGGKYKLLPFYDDSIEDESVKFNIESCGGEFKDNILTVFDDDEIGRDFNVATDTWSAGDLTFKIISPVISLPDPETASEAEVKTVVTPAVLAEVTVDNRNCTIPRRAFFAYEGNDPYSGMHRAVRNDESQNFFAVGTGQINMIASDDSAVDAGLGFNLITVLDPVKKENLAFGLGYVGALIMNVPPGEMKTFRCAVAFYQQGNTTAGLRTSYYYTKFFQDVDEVAKFALDNFEVYLKKAEEADARIADSALNPERKFMLAHAIRSYYGSTQFLQLEDGSPFWVVNEGEYRMKNTFDLTVDQLFFEIKMNPWTVKNELDMFVKRYSYHDKVRFPGDDTEYPGGISFTHDMGVRNIISRPHYSAYELFGLEGCFSHMTHEQLVNWILCAAVYVEQTNDEKWLDNNMEVFKACLESMLNRDNPDPEKRNGIMSLDSSRCMGGAEITTYDSLDTSLGQARNNIYMAVKCFAAYLALEKILKDKNSAKFAETAAEQVAKCAETLADHLTADGYIPAIIDEDNDSKIIPAIEGLVFPLFTGCKDALDENGRFKKLISTLKTHLNTILRPGTCLFDDGGWKLSSTSDNSWLSKIYLCQFVAENILRFPRNEKADKAHVEWLLNPDNGYFAWSDQMVNGIAKGSKYYPRGVTAILWMEKIIT